MPHEPKETHLLTSLSELRTRRSFLRGTIVAGIAVTGAGLVPALPAAASGAEGGEPEDPTPASIFTVARTAERLAVTFYTNGVNNAGALGIRGSDLDYLKAALIEEQRHELFFAANGGNFLTSTFSFPSGAATFQNLDTFIATQQQLEGAFDSAFIAAVEEFAAMGQPDLARIACQIAMIESEHRVLGRVIGHLMPADNWTYAPQTVDAVGDAPGVLAAAGYLSPVPGNTYTYQQVDFSSPHLASVIGKIEYQNGPFVAPED